MNPRKSVELVNSQILKFVINRIRITSHPPKQVFCPRCSGDRGGAEDRGGLTEGVSSSYFCKYKMAIYRL